MYLGKILKPKTLNIMVGHGKYIRKMLKLSHHPKNTQAYLVKYTKQDDKWEQEVLDIDFIPNVLSELHAPQDVESKFLKCDYKYHEDIKSKCK